MSSSRIWFITGVSSGFGLELALYVLRAGHTVYGTVRNREKSSGAVSKIETAGGKCVVLDVNVLESIPTVIQGILEEVGRIDVLVNNAGWAVMGALEDMK
jgi:NAD(P)-dependent dehydrogenase (short-subunit alcohol dehydrogenase family)